MNPEKDGPVPSATSILMNVWSRRAKTAVSASIFQLPILALVYSVNYFDYL